MSEKGNENDFVGRTYLTWTNIVMRFNFATDFQTSFVSFRASNYANKNFQLSDKCDVYICFDINYFFVLILIISDV